MRRQLRKGPLIGKGGNLRGEKVICEHPIFTLIALRLSRELGDCLIK